MSEIIEKELEEHKRNSPAALSRIINDLKKDSKGGMSKDKCKIYLYLY